MGDGQSVHHLSLSSLSLSSSPPCPLPPLLFLFLPHLLLILFPLLFVFFFYFFSYFLILFIFHFFLLLLLSLLSFPLPPLLNVFYLNLSCVYSFCFVLLNFTSLRVVVCLSNVLPIKLLYKHIIMHGNHAGPVPKPGGCEHRVPETGTWMENGTQLCPKVLLQNTSHFGHNYTTWDRQPGRDNRGRDW